MQDLYKYEMNFKSISFLTRYKVLKLVVWAHELPDRNWIPKNNLSYIVK